MRIDAHQHYWKTSRNDYGWLKPSLGRIYADYMPEHLKPLLERFQIHRTVVVQAAPTSEETEFLLQIANQDETIAGVVGWLDLESDQFEQEWNRFRKNPKFVGLRPMIQDLPSEWITNHKVVQHLQLLSDSQFPVDLQANPRHLPYIVRLLEQVPELNAVIDHLAKPPIIEGTMEPWASDMRQIAFYPNTMCKLSGMVPEKTDAPWSKAAIKPYMEQAILTFGKNRVMFGSDWPVCLFSADYDQVVELFEYGLGPDWTDEEWAAVYGRNAIHFYRLTVNRINS
jgi:L-fuconolactonase